MPLVKKHILLFLVLFSTNFMHAQYSAKDSLNMDSLAIVVESKMHDTLRVEALYDWSSIVYSIDSELSNELDFKTIKICESNLDQKELDLSEREQHLFQKYLIIAYYSIGNQMKRLYKYDESQTFLETARDLAVFYEDSSRVVKITLDIGRLFNSLYKYDESLKEYNEGKIMAKVIGEKKLIAKSHRYVGDALYDLGRIKESLAEYDSSLVVYEELNDTFQLGNLYYILSYVYENQGRLSEAIDFAHKSIKADDLLNDQHSKAYSLYNLAFMYEDLNELDTAIIHHKKALNILKEYNDESLESSILHSIADLYLEKRNYIQAKKYLDASLPYRLKANKPERLGNFYCTYAEYYIGLEDYKKANIYCDTCMSFYALNNLNSSIAYVNELKGLINYKTGKYNIARKNLVESLRGYNEANDFLSRLEPTEILYKTYKKLGLYKKALSTYEDFITIRDSIQNQENLKLLLRRKFETKLQKQIMADSLASVQKVQIQKDKLVSEKQRSYFLLSGLVLALLLGAFIYNRLLLTFRQKKLIENQKSKVDRTLKELKKEKQKSEQLLLNILPFDTADELKKNGKVSTKFVENATVIFTDFKGFTKLSLKLEPTELVEEINYCFSVFDDIMKKYGVEKIKTIGDAYVAVGGLPKPSKTHAIDALRAAIGIQKFIINRRTTRMAANLPSFEMRVGLHSGSLVTGVVGKNKFQFDIWGNTVNVASRLENTCEIDQINISRSTYELVKDISGFQFISRGKINVKGETQMEMYYAQEVK